MTDLVRCAATVLAVAATLALAAYLVHLLGTRRSPLSRREVDLATSFGISAVLSAVLGVIMTTVNVGINEAFPAAFLESIAIGIVVATPTAYIVVPRVLRLTTPLARSYAPSNVLDRPS